MALSDACYDYLTAVAKAARELAEAAHHYSAPDNALVYGPEIDALRRACVAASEVSNDPEAACRVTRLAASIMTYHDTFPSMPAAIERRGRDGQVGSHGPSGA
jgi:hypothetical protein